MIKSILARMAGTQPDIKKDLCLAQRIDFDKLPEERKGQLLRKANELYKNEFFHFMLDQIKADQTEETMKKAETKEQIWAGRIHLLLVELIREDTERYHNQWLETQKVEPPIDKHKPF